ncbi:MAG TPA: hypothetical protein VL284_02815 [Thermoanaerobaculia bacterium]|nr:hypothetical protein [Thermoanaerobaculia bacterium]
MKRALIVALCLLACSKKEEPVAVPQPAPVTPKIVTRTREPQPPPETSPHPGTWSIPPRGVALWLVADDARTEFGGNLTTWTNEYVPTAKASADRLEMQPIVITNAINQHSVIRFDGVSNIMETNIDISPQGMPDATIFAVFSSHTAAPSPLRKVYGDDDGGFDRAAGLDDRAGDKNYSVFTGSGVAGDFTLSMNETYLTCDQFTKSDLSTWVDGKAMLDKVACSWGTALPHMFIGGSGTSYHEPWQGDIAEIIVYERVLSELERMQVEDYLGKKYGIALTR